MAWNSILSPGRWWDGSQRTAIVRETRDAIECGYCASRKEALSFTSIQGKHVSSSDLPEGAVEAIHRIVTDPARAITLDVFSDAVGAGKFPVPEPDPGPSSQLRPAGAKRNLAWVSTVAPEDASELEKAMYPGGWKAPNIRRAMSLVPEEVIDYFDLCDEHYIPTKYIWDFDRQIRAITNSQIEFIAARVSILNGCFY